MGVMRGERREEWKVNQHLFRELHFEIEDCSYYLAQRFDVELGDAAVAVGWRIVAADLAAVAVGWRIVAVDLAAVAVG